MLLVQDMLRNHKARMTVAFVDKLKRNENKLDHLNNKSSNAKIKRNFKQEVAYKH